MKDADGPGYYVIRNVVKGIASDDVNKLDASQIAALNAKVGAKKLITLTSGVKGAKYAYGSRTNVAADSTKATTTEAVALARRLMPRLVFLFCSL